ncbi:MAG TPA: hypothetical protein VN428_27300 [Bryobacteraceae bacterium]|nr:hypothetical protein [Bryobacteraceae bacterium]
MTFEAGKTYRARTADGEQIRFTVTVVGDGTWLNADLDGADGPEPNVWLNTRLLLWVSTELESAIAVTKAAEEVIDALERSADDGAPGSSAGL